MRDILKNIFISLVIFVVLVSLFSSATGTFKKENVISLSETASKIKAGEIKKASVEGEKVELVFNNDSTAITYKEPDGSFLESLKNLGLKEEDISKISMEVKTASGFNLFLMNILPAVLPFLLVLVFFWLMFRQAKSSQTQAFSFGATQMKVFDPNKEKVTFKDVAGANEAKEELKEIVEFLRSP